MSGESARRQRLHPALSQRQAFALLDETGSVRNLMRDSIQAIQDMRLVRIDGDAVLTLGSIGVEKTMKVMLGCASVTEHGAWPTRETLKAWNHDIEKLNDLLAAAIDAGLKCTSSRGFAEQLAARINDSSLLPLIFTALARYGKSGRFHNLDILATDRPGKLDDPAEYWEHVELHAREAHPELGEVPFGDNAGLNAYEAKLRSLVASELDTWWWCVHRLGVLGCFGELGKKVGWEIWEVGRPALGLT